MFAAENIVDQDEGDEGQGEQKCALVNEIIDLVKSHSDPDKRLRELVGVGRDYVGGH